MWINKSWVVSRCTDLFRHLLLFCQKYFDCKIILWFKFITIKDITYLGFTQFVYFQIKNKYSGMLLELWIYRLLLSLVLFGVVRESTKPIFSLLVKKNVGRYSCSKSRGESWCPFTVKTEVLTKMRFNVGHLSLCLSIAVDWQ